MCLLSHVSFLSLHPPKNSLLICRFAIHAYRDWCISPFISIGRFTRTIAVSLSCSSKVNNTLQLSWIMLEILERGEILCFTVKRDGLLSIFRPKKLLRNGSFVLFVCFTVFHVYSSCALLLQVSDNPCRSAITLGSLKLIVFIASISTHSGHWRLHIF